MKDVQKHWFDENVNT